jgi:hypothetical protein
MQPYLTPVNALLIMRDRSRIMHSCLCNDRAVVAHGLLSGLAEATVY